MLKPTTALSTWQPSTSTTGPSPDPTKPHRLSSNASGRPGRQELSAEPSTSRPSLGLPPFTPGRPRWGGRSTTTDDPRCWEPAFVPPDFHVRKLLEKMKWQLARLQSLATLVLRFCLGCETMQASLMGWSVWEKGGEEVSHHRDGFAHRCPSRKGGLASRAQCSTPQGPSRPPAAAQKPFAAASGRLLQYHTRHGRGGRWRPVSAHR